MTKKRSPASGPCSECGATMVIRNIQQCFCSDSCRARDRRRRIPDPRRATRQSRRVIHAKAKLRAATRGTRGNSTWIQGQCGECGEQFMRNGRMGLCSKRCGDAERKRARRALQAGVKITPGRRVAVHERDDWTCQLCALPVNRDAKFPAPDAAVIDHRVALARGGEHGPANWQTAHNLCNSYKRDLSMAEIAA